MGVGRCLVTLWLLKDGLLLLIEAHLTECWMGYRWASDGLWMGVSTRWRGPQFHLGVLRVEVARLRDTA